MCFHVTLLGTRCSAVCFCSNNTHHRLLQVHCLWRAGLQAATQYSCQCFSAVVLWSCLLLQNTPRAHGDYVFSENNPFTGDPAALEKGKDLFKRGLLSEAALALEAEVRASVWAWGFGLWGGSPQAPHTTPHTTTTHTTHHQCGTTLTTTPHQPPPTTTQWATITTRWGLDIWGPAGTGWSQCSASARVRAAGFYLELGGMSRMCMSAILYASVWYHAM